MFGNFFGNPSQGGSYEDLQRQQVLAAALANRSLTPNYTPGGGIAQIAQAFASRRMGRQASQAMQKERNRAGEQLRAVSESAGLDPQLIEMANNPYMSAGQKQVLGALIKQKMAPAKARSMYKGADGYNYWSDDPTTRVNPNITIPGQEPKIHKVKQRDGSEVLVAFDAASKSMQPVSVPNGGTAVPANNQLTESQSKLTLFQSMQTETDPVLDGLEQQFDPSNLPDYFAGSVLGGNYAKSREAQIYNSAASAWAEGALRIATGAAATQPEIDRTKKTYFAEPGDDIATIRFKSEMRKMYQRSIQRALGVNGVEGKLPTPEDFLKDYQGAAQAPRSEPVQLDGYIIKEVQ